MGCQEPDRLLDHRGGLSHRPKVDVVRDVGGPVVVGGLLEVVAHLEGERYVLGKIRDGFPPALRRMREACGRERMAVAQAS